MNQPCKHDGNRGTNQMVFWFFVCIIMKRLSISLVTLVLAASLVGCNKATETTTSSKMKPGTYTASTAGMNDDVTVEVEVTENEIKSVKVTSHAETPGIGGELVDKDGVDNVTGATITSGAIKTAVKDAIKQAGGDPDAFKKEVTYEDRKDVEADVVVVGGGGAGLASAVELLQNGKSVAIIEKAGEIGGDTLFIMHQTQHYNNMLK